MALTVPDDVNLTDERGARWFSSLTPSGSTRGVASYREWTARPQQ